ncbi:splicing factor, putative [Eimeria acervulina]|uniref:Splicing factor, putative n=1 Tax=Eimeria acervulina TaxID=5801 RepID=U6GJ62_EIMAC|nr:splicing factor, putative [Eimeria acervulina]CDI80200.1 splicing factor, putative [Eimeria acervulina]
MLLSPAYMLTLGSTCSIMSRQHYSSERLYVGNLPYDVTEREVDDLFYKFGRIRDIEVKRSRKNDTSFAFVVFDDKYSVDDAIERRDGMRYGDMCLRVERGGERRGGRGGGDGGSYGPPRRSAFRVRVHGLPPTASWQDLKDHMRKAGDVGFASVENRVGIVEYPTREEMEYAIKRLDRSEFCNIFHRAQIRVERDYGSAGEEEYERGGRRSRSYSERRNRSRSPRREASHADHESSSRRQRDCPGSREASRVNAHSDVEQCPSVRSDKLADIGGSWNRANSCFEELLSVHSLSATWWPDGGWWHGQRHACKETAPRPTQACAFGLSNGVVVMTRRVRMPKVAARHGLR